MSRESSTMPVCAKSTLSLGHVWTITSTVRCLQRFAQTHLTKFPPTLGVIPTRRRLLNIFKTPQHQHPSRPRLTSTFLARRTAFLAHMKHVRSSELAAAFANASAVPFAPSSAVMWESLRTSESLRRRWLTFRCARFIVHELVAHEAHELFNSCLRHRLRHEVFRSLLVFFFVVNRPDLEASCIQRFCLSTCFALPSPLRLARHIVAKASRCRFSLHDSPRSFATLWLPSPSDAVLTAASSSLLADDNATTCYALVDTLRQ